MKSTHRGDPRWNFQEESFLMQFLQTEPHIVWVAEFWLLIPEHLEILRVGQLARSNPGNSDDRVPVLGQVCIRGAVPARDVTHDLILGFVIRAILFSPSGYLMNGVKSDGIFWTTCIIPEPEFSQIRPPMMTLSGRLWKSSGQKQWWPHCSSNVTQCFPHPRRLRLSHLDGQSAMCSEITVVFLPVLLKGGSNSQVD